MKAINLKCEYLHNPIGIDIQKPRLSWNCEGGVKQSAYRIVATSNGKTVWNSGKVCSDSMHAEYPHALFSRQRVEWSVTLWDENDKEGEGMSAFFETGVLQSDDFTAQIGKTSLFIHGILLDIQSGRINMGSQNIHAR